jgi:hypothetical protein
LPILLPSVGSQDIPAEWRSLLPRAAATIRARAGQAGGGLGQKAGARCRVPGVRASVHGVWCRVSGARYETFSARCLVSGVRCQVPRSGQVRSGQVRCQVSGARYLGAGRQSDAVSASVHGARCRWRVGRCQVHVVGCQVHNAH